MMIDTPAPMADALRYLPVVNQNTQMIPSYGLMRVTGMDAVGNFQVNQPSADGENDLLFNGPVPILGTSGVVTGYGQASYAMPATLPYSTKNPDGAAPAAGEIWGPAKDSWLLSKNKYGFTCMSAGQNGYANFQRMSQQYIGLLKPTQGASGSHYELNGSCSTGSGGFSGSPLLLNDVQEVSYDALTGTTTNIRAAWFVELAGRALGSPIFTGYLVGNICGRRLFVGLDPNGGASGSGSDAGNYIDVVVCVQLIQTG